MLFADVVYLASAIDFEGCIQVRKHKPDKRMLSPRYSLEVSVGNTHKGVLDWAQGLLGGHIKLAATGRKHRLWEWVLCGQAAEDLLRSILPHLKIKEPQAGLALEFRANFTSYRNKGRLPSEELALREGFYLALQESKRAILVAV